MKYAGNEQYRGAYENLPFQEPYRGRSAAFPASLGSTAKTLSPLVKGFALAGYTSGLAPVIGAVEGSLAGGATLFLALLSPLHVNFKKKEMKPLLLE